MEIYSEANVFKSVAVFFSGLIFVQVREFWCKCGRYWCILFKRMDFTSHLSHAHAAFVLDSGVN